MDRTDSLPSSAILMLCTARCFIMRIFIPVTRPIWASTLVLLDWLKRLIGKKATYCDTYVLNRIQASFIVRWRESRINPETIPMT